MKHKIINYYFTNSEANIYCVRPTMSNQLFAFLVWQYSRSNLPMRDRLLKLFDDMQQAYKEWKLEQKDYISLQDFVRTIDIYEELNPQYLEQKASEFLEKWWVKYWHNSLKDADKIRFAIENVSQLVAKIIENPFPPLWDFQEKSTRYLNFSKENLVFPEDVRNSKYYKEIKEITEWLIDTYTRMLPVVKQVLIDNNIIDRSLFQSESSYQNTLNAKVFDICRYLLPVNSTTSLWATFSARTLETHLSYMLSHPLAEVRDTAKQMWQEALKLSPWLLKHIWENDFEIKRRQRMSEFQTREIQFVEIYQWISDTERVNLINVSDLDNELIASILYEIWEYSYDEALLIAKASTEKYKLFLLDEYLKYRWKYDSMPRTFVHWTVMFEYLLDFWAYRDIQRHRATRQIWKWPTAIYWYDYPEINLPGMEIFKKEYDKIMLQTTLTCRKIYKEEPYISQYCSALWHLTRTTFEMSPHQIAYVFELRTKPEWHDSYRRLFLESYRQLKEKTPLFWEFIRITNENKIVERK